MGSQPGKKFEEDFVRQAEKDKHYEVHRIKDSQFYRGATNIADFIIFNGAYWVYAECKSTLGKSISISKQTDGDGELKRYGAFSAKQLDRMLNDVTANWTICIYVINFRDVDETYFITAQQLRNFIDDPNRTRKSIPIDWLRDNGEQIQQKKRRTRYDYYMDGLFLDILLMKNAEG